MVRRMPFAVRIRLDRSSSIASPFGPVEVENGRDLNIAAAAAATAVLPSTAKVDGNVIAFSGSHCRLYLTNSTPHTI